MTWQVTRPDGTTFPVSEAVRDMEGRRVTDRIVLPTPVEQAMPWRGPCSICGGPDARHRVLNSVQDMLRFGDPAPMVAEDFGLPVDVVEFIAEHWRQDDETWEM